MSDTRDERGGLAYMNVQRVALRLGVAPHTVRRWTASGFLPCTRTPGGHRRFREEDVEELAQNIGGSNHLAARRARERELETLLDTSIALVSRLELEDLLKEIARRLTRLLDCHFCAISVLDEESRTVRMLADYDHSGRRLPDTEEYPLSRYPLTRRVLDEQVEAVVNLNDPAADPDEVRELSREGDKSLLMMPLIYGGRSIGLLELMDHYRERRYSHQELRICRAIAGQAAVALNNARLFSASRAATQDLDTLAEEVAAFADQFPLLSAASDVDSLLAAAAKTACDIFAATSCVASAEGRSTGFTRCAPSAPDARDALTGRGVGGAGGKGAPVSTGPRDRARRGDGSARGRRSGAFTGAEVLTVSDASGGSEVDLALTLPRASHSGELELLGALAAAVNACLDGLS